MIVLVQVNIDVEYSIRVRIGSFITTKSYVKIDRQRWRKQRKKRRRKYKKRRRRYKKTRRYIDKAAYRKSIDLCCCTSMRRQGSK